MSCERPDSGPNTKMAIAVVAPNTTIGTAMTELAPRCCATCRSAGSAARSASVDRSVDERVSGEQLAGDARLFVRALEMADLLREGSLLWIAMRDLPADDATMFDEVDAAPIGQLRNRQARHCAQQPLGVEGGGEHAHLAQQLQARLGDLAFRDVAAGNRHAPNVPLRVADGRDVMLAPGALEDELLRHGLAVQDALGERLPQCTIAFGQVLVQVASEQLGRRKPGQAGHVSRRGLVGVANVAVDIREDEMIGNGVEHGGDAATLGAHDGFDAASEPLADEAQMAGRDRQRALVDGSVDGLLEEVQRGELRVDVEARIGVGRRGRDVGVVIADGLDQRTEELGQATALATGGHERGRQLFEPIERHDGERRTGAVGCWHATSRALRVSDASAGRAAIG